MCSSLVYRSKYFFILVCRYSLTWQTLITQYKHTIMQSGHTHTHTCTQKLLCEVTQVMLRQDDTSNGWWFKQPVGLSTHTQNKYTDTDNDTQNEYRHFQKVQMTVLWWCCCCCVLTPLPVRFDHELECIVQCGAFYSEIPLNLDCELLLLDTDSALEARLISTLRSAMLG